MTERLHFHFLLSCIGEGNGNPLYCSCLENCRDGGAWWEAIYGVTQSQTRLKWLSSSSTVYIHIHEGYTYMSVCLCYMHEDIWNDAHQKMSLMLVTIVEKALRFRDAWKRVFQLIFPLRSLNYLLCVCDTPSRSPFLPHCLHLFTKNKYFKEIWKCYRISEKGFAIGKFQSIYKCNVEFWNINTEKRK